MSSRLAARQQTPPTLRERQHEQTRNLILDTLIDQLAETGAFDYSAFELARRAGVSVRTIYRHFPDRDSLLEAMSTRVNERIGLYNLPTEMSGVPDLARELFRRFDEHPQLILAQITTAAGNHVRSAGRRDRVARMRKAVEGIAPDLDEKTRQLRTAALSSLLSANTWQRMREELGLTGAEAGEATAWAIEVLAAAIVDENRAAKKKKGTR